MTDRQQTSDDKDTKHLFRTQWGMWKQPANDNEQLSKAALMLLEILEFNT